MWGTHASLSPLEEVARLTSGGLSQCICEYATPTCLQLTEEVHAPTCRIHGTLTMSTIGCRLRFEGAVHGMPLVRPAHGRAGAGVPGSSDCPHRVCHEDVYQPR